MSRVLYLGTLVVGASVLTSAMKRTRHCRVIERIAMVGEARWEAWMARVCRPFTMASIRYFDASKIDEAWTWLNEA